MTLELVSAETVQHKSKLCIYFYKFYLFIKDYMERESVAESLQVNFELHRIHRFKSLQWFACIAK